METPDASAQGRALPIVQYPDPVLREHAVTVTGYDDDLRALVADMFASMYAADGVGLAANQVGRPERVFVFDCADADEVRHKGVVVNPVLELPGPGDRVLDDDLEGCLSVVGENAMVARPDHAVVRGSDEHGNPVVVEGTGLLARCLQHETDHLDGQLYLDRVPSGERRRLVRSHAQRLAEQAAGGGPSETSSGSV